MLKTIASQPRIRKETTKKVVLEARVVSGNGGGPDKTILNGPRFLAPAGYETVCAYMHPPHDPGFAELWSKADRRGVAMRSVPDRGAWDWRVVPRLLNICRREKVNIWHAHDYKSNALGLIIRKFWPMRLVTTLHGWVKHTSRTPLYYWVDKKCLPHYESIICVSDDLLRYCIDNDIPNDRCRLIENGVDIEEYSRRCAIEVAKQRFGLRSSDFVVAAVGRLSPEKGFDILVDSIAVLQQQGIEAHLLIAGSGDSERDLRDQIARQGLGNRVHLLGQMSDPRLLYEAADVVASSSHREGLPNVLLEAMAMEVPVVATPVNGIPKLLSDDVNGLIVPTGSAKELAFALNGLARDPARRARLAMAGRITVVKRYSFATRMDKVRRLYDELLDRY